MQTRSSDEKAVCLSVCQTRALWWNGRSVQIFIPYERPFSQVFRELEWLVGGDSFYLKFWVNRREIADFRPIIARSTSAVTLAKKFQLTLIGSPLRALQWTSYVTPRSPKGWFKNAVSKIWTISCNNSEKVRDRMSVLITNNKSLTGFRLIPSSMTLNDLERRNSRDFFFTDIDSFAGQLRHSGWR